MRLAALFLLAVTAGAQTFSSHSGWSFTDTLQTATDVFVADIVSGAAVDDGSQVSVKATLRVVRVLAGNTAAGAELAVAWQYKPAPFAGPEITSQIPLVRGLWFLRKTEPLQAGGMLPSLGGYYLPAGSAPRYYGQNAPLQYKIACEIAPMIEQLATQHGADLAPHAPQPPVRGVLAPWIQTSMQYQALTMALQALDKAATAEVYAYFSGLPDPNLKLAGLQGRLTAGDASAILDLEKNVAAFAPLLSGGAMPLTAMGVDLRGNLPAAHALGRLALSETPLPGIEGGVAFPLAATRSPEVLPYLVAMLGSPNPGTRDGALAAFCQLLGPLGETVKAQPLWRPEMSQYCPDHSPLNDAATEEKDTRFWKQWWETHREEIARTATLPSVSAPARYNAQVSLRPVEIPMEIRFMSLLHMTGSQGDHYHAVDGSIVGGPGPGEHDPVAAQLTGPDRDVYRQVISAVNTKLAEIQKRAEEMVNAARIAGTMPPIKDDRMPALKTGLDDLRSRLTPAGWQVVERFLMQMGIGMGGAGAPAK